MDQHILTPVQVEQRLLSLDHDNEKAHALLRDAEAELAQAEVELRMARARALLSTFTQGEKYTVQQRDALVQVAVEKEEVAHAVAITKAKAARSRVSEVKTSIDVARSLGTSVRTALEGS